jgi:hypothetical protein
MRIITDTVPGALAATAQAVYGLVGVGGATAVLMLLSGAHVSSLSDRRLKVTRQTSRLCAAERAPGRILLLARLTIAVRWGRDFAMVSGADAGATRRCRPSSPPNDP